MRKDLPVIVQGYGVFIEPISIEPGIGYAAVVAGLPGCMSEGETPEEAMAGVGEAIDSWLAVDARVRLAALASHYAPLA